MKQKSLFGLILALLLAVSELTAQGWRFPNCDDWEVTDITFTNNQDSILVTVFNDCDTCYQYAYTGIRIYRNNDTLASNQYSFVEMSPDNNSALTYKVKVLIPFSIGNTIRVQMTAGICDSIPINNTLLGMDWTKNDKSKLVITPNPTREFVKIVSQEAIHILNVTIYDMHAKPIKYIEGNESNISVRDLADGIYFIVVQTEKDIISKKLIVN